MASCVVLGCRIFRNLMCLLVIFACQSVEPDPQHLANVQAWQQQRVQDLLSDQGWLNLVGLFWLEPGEYRLGNDPACELQIPAPAPGQLGRLIISAAGYQFVAAPEAGVTLADSVITRVDLKADQDVGGPTILNCGSLRWFLIRRGELLGLRVRDLQSKARGDFKGIDYFPVSSKWRVRARFEKFTPPDSIALPNVMGTSTVFGLPGLLHFELDGKQFTLEPMGSLQDEKLFVVFGDETNDGITYGGGRFLYVATPDSTDSTWIDFNLAYNPPCAFTEFATCPLPRPENKLPVLIEAGEKNYADALH